MLEVGTQGLPLFRDHMDCQMKQAKPVYLSVCLSVRLSLQQATGAVLVSQEPSKVILYRGWGGGEKSDPTGKKNISDAERKVVSRPVVSPELLDAIRTECGLQNQPKDDLTPQVG